MIIGGDAAGMSAASRIARSKTDWDTVVVERSGVVSYAACGIPSYLKGDIADPQELLVRSAEASRQMGIDVRLETEATGIDAGSGRVFVRHGSDEHAEPYDALILATGARTTARDGVDLAAPNSFAIRHYDDALALDRFLDEQRPARATIVGTETMALELAEALVARCDHVTIADARSTAPPGYDAEMAEEVARELTDNGVELRLGHHIRGAQRGADGWITALEADDGGWDTDVVVVAAAAAPNVELGVQAGAATDETGALRTDEHQRTTLDHVWAAGDCASTRHLVTGRRVWQPLGTTANRQGRVAGDAVIGGDELFPGIAGTALVRVLGLHCGRTGIT